MCWPLWAFRGPGLPGCVETTDRKPRAVPEPTMKGVPMNFEQWMLLFQTLALVAIALVLIVRRV